jgi:hypothetical protein
VQPRTGLGGLIDNVLGGGGLRVGQRATANLGGVPAEFRNQYRDGNGVYYRSDGRSIYQIDAQTQTVVRVDRSADPKRLLRPGRASLGRAVWRRAVRPTSLDESAAKASH